MLWSISFRCPGQEFSNMGFCCPDQYTRSDYFSELSKASGCLAEERSTERLERERTEERKDVVFKKSTYGATGEANCH